MPVNFAWYGDYAALYLELGVLSEGRARKDGTTGNPVGEITIFVGYDWAAIMGGSSIRGSASSVPERESLVSNLRGEVITSAHSEAGSSELVIVLANGVKLATVSEAPGQPDWSVTFTAKRLGHMSMRNGALHFERGAS